MRIAPSTDCSASRLWGGRRSITGTSERCSGSCHLQCHDWRWATGRELPTKFVHGFAAAGWRTVDNLWTAGPPRSGRGAHTRTVPREGSPVEVLVVATRL